MKLSVIIPSFNRLEDVRICLKGIRMQSEQPHEIILVDDGSSDGTPERISEEFPKVRILRHGKNSGPAVARNTGAIAATGDYLVFMDSDTEWVEADIMDNLRSEVLAHQNFDCFAFRIMLADGTVDRVRWYHYRNIKQSVYETFETNYFSGTFFCIRREVFLAAGMFPDFIFMFNEEVELFYRLVRTGRKILYIPSIWICHHVSSSARNDRIAYYYQRRNQILLVYQYFPFWRAMSFILPRVLMTLIRAIGARKLRIYIGSLYDAMSILRDSKIRRDPLSHELWLNLIRFRE